MSHYDLIVIGSGPSGRSAAIQAGKLKRRVLVVERDGRLGGVSVHTGTIPSKTLRETVLNLSGYRERSFYGRSYRVKDEIDAGDLKERLHKTLDHEVDVLEHQFARNHVETQLGEATFIGKNEIEITSEDGEKCRVTADKFLIATGTRTYRPDDVPFNGKTILDGDEFLEMDQIPRSLIVIGAGVIGVEYATMFAALDVRVTLIEPRDTFLDYIDRTLIGEFTHQIRENGLDLRLGSPVTKVEDK
ncbi:MAG: FAD-dependent oxidoreductase, partial [Halocynthiibacter sp.]